MVAKYVASARHYIDIDEKHFRKRLPLFVLFRLLQVLGAYGFRGYYERKPHFINSIPPAITNLRNLLNEGACPYPYLNEILLKICALPQFEEHKPREFKRDDGFRVATTNVYPAHEEDGPPT